MVVVLPAISLITWITSSARTVSSVPRRASLTRTIWLSRMPERGFHDHPHGVGESAEEIRPGGNGGQKNRADGKPFPAAVWWRI